MASVCVGMSMSGARAVDIGPVDIALKSTLYQSLEINSNYQMRSDNPGETYTPVSTVIFDALARTPTMRFAATVDLSYQTYFGPGAFDLLPAFNRGFRGSAEAYEQTTTYKVEGSVRTQQAFRLQLAETGLSTVGGDVTTSWVETGVRQQVGYLDLMTWSARATALEFSDPTQRPSLDLLTTGMWIHRATELTDVSPLVQFESLTFGNPAVGPNLGHPEFMIFRGTLGTNSRLTKRLLFQGAAGVIDVTLNQNGGVLPSNTFQPSSGTRVDWIGNILATYNFNSRDTLSVAAAQTVGPDSLGVLRKFDVIGAVFTHQFDHPGTLSFSTDYSHQPLVIGGFTDLYSTAVTYGYAFLPDSRLAVSYRFRQRTGFPSNVNSHAVFMSISSDVTILPSAIGQVAIPTPADVTALLSWPAAWIRPWRDPSWLQR